ncbi:MAG: hypothetical protein EXQ94_02315 [Alphaproteobacteria bacterium]|nr:hypothetical protein [Alphaproteobacteria bacterium]
MIDRDNLMAVAWGVLYGTSLVLCIGAGDAFGIAPTVTVPLVVVVLPFVVGLALRGIERAVDRRG